MVMEAPPSPQSVGREFVRQYYTLLNRAPTHLHRFYNNQSSFVHGGLDPNRETSPMIGQKQIHQKIQQLNFRDCHAKITQVDAQATLGNGVVVQVTGELSNAGQPMRRFTQTFVLASQSPKKYYVHNDIFRYQDEIVSDDECEPESRSEPEDELNQERQVVGMPEVVPQAIPTYYTPPTIQPVPPHHSQPIPVIPSQPPLPTVNGVVHPEEIPVIPAQGHLVSAPGLAGAPLTVPVTATTAPSAPAPEEQECSPEEVTCAPEQTEQPLEESQETPVESATSNEPKTYATLLKSGSGGGGVTGSNAPQGGNTYPSKSVSPPLNQNRYEYQSGPVPSSGPRNNGGGNVGNNIGVGNFTVAGGGSQGGSRGPRRSQQAPGMMGQRQDSQRTTSGSQPGRNSFNDDGNFNFEDRRKSQNNFNDSNQLFLGNLPQNAKEEELREIFAQFGTIVNLRVLSKSGKQMGGSAGGRTPPNYGFITYETQEAVQMCLAAKPLFYPHNDKNGVQLNVEEKKVKDRPSYGGGGPNRVPTEDGMPPRSRDNGQPRRGPGGPRSGAPGGRTNSFNRGALNRASGPGLTNTYSNNNSRR